MRVTELQKQHAFTSGIQDRLSNLMRIQQELGTGKSIFTPSENVNAADQALRIKESMASDAQFAKNVDDGKAWVSSADSQLQAIDDLLTQIDSLALAADNSSENADDRHSASIQIDQKLNSLMDLVNSTHGDRYLFGGFDTTSAPYSATRDANGHIVSVTTNTANIAGKIYRRIGDGEDVQINVSGAQLFQPAGGAGTDQDLFYVISSLRDTIANNNTPPAGQEGTLSNNVLRDKLKAIKDRVTDQQTYLGSIGQRLDQTAARLKDRAITLTGRLEDAQGVDMTDLVSRLATEQGAYDALSSMGTKLISQSLVDYLK